MKRILTFFLSLLLLAPSLSEAQYSRYIIRLKDKGATTYSLADPTPYLSPRAIERRTRYHIAIDSSDLPIPPSYLSQLQQVPHLFILNVSRWLNAACILVTDPDALASVNALSFVEGSAPVAAKASFASNKLEHTYDPAPSPRRRAGQEGVNDYFAYGNNSFNEIHLHWGEFLHNVGLRGQGMQIALLDGGFFNYTGLKAFDSARNNGQILSTWDFVTGNASVAEDDAHGMECLSTIAANIPGEFIGKAPKASFHLFRTEDVFSEFPIEEFNWACGAERADSTGADLISSSLGYGYQFTAPIADYPKTDLDGNTTMSARAADMAAKKGLLVFVAAGNSGTDYWHTIVTPADADSVLAVGAVNIQGAVGNFSAYGPSADGRVKPDLAAVGVSALIQNTNNSVATGNGTSFACPNMAGLSACLWQGFPEFNNMRIVRALREAGNIYNTPDNRTGYGIPNLKTAFETLLTEFATSSASVNGCMVTLTWNSKDVQAMRYEIERKLSGQLSFTKIEEVQPAAGSVLGNHTYQLNNSLTATPAGTVSYRIRQVIDTNAVSLADIYLNTLEITTQEACPGSTGLVIATRLFVSPNPTSGNTSFILETADEIPSFMVALYDLSGRRIWGSSLSKPAGRMVIDIPSAKLAAGKYIVRVDDGKKLTGQTEFLKL